MNQTNTVTTNNEVLTGHSPRTTVYTRISLRAQIYANQLIIPTILTLFKKNQGS